MIDKKPETPYTDSIKNKILAIIERVESLPSSNAEFQAGFNEAKNEIMNRVKEGQL